jgi:hypothetical protein
LRLWRPADKEGNGISSPPGMTTTPSATPPLFAARRMAIQVVAWLVGVGLLALVIHNAIGRGTGEDSNVPSGWQLIREANPWLVVGLGACTLVNLGVNGVIFWLVIQPLKPLRLVHLQLLNLVTAVLNYAPIRAGLIARVAYHLRVDRMPMLLIGGWFAATLFTMLLTMAAVVGATVLRPQFDWMWLAMLLALLTVGGLMTLAMMSQPLVARVGKGMDQMLRNPRSLWGAIGLRLVDIAGYIGRMACAVAILRLDLSARDVVFLAIAALAMSLNPLGRFGFREWAVALIASQLVSMQTTGGELKAKLAQLALVDSAGEAIVSIPLGAVSLLWYRRRWVKARGVNIPVPPAGAADGGTIVAVNSGPES